MTLGLDRSGKEETKMGKMFIVDVKSSPLRKNKNESGKLVVWKDELKVQGGKKRNNKECCRDR